MTLIDPEFLAENVERLEEFLLSLPIGTLFTGELYQLSDERFTGLSLEGFSEEPMWLDAASIGRLFMAPDESTVAALNVFEGDDGTPAGVRRTNEGIRSVKLFHPRARPLRQARNALIRHFLCIQVDSLSGTKLDIRIYIVELPHRVGSCWLDITFDQTGVLSSRHRSF